MAELAREGTTTDPTFAAYFRAQQINHAAGGAVVAPWEVHLLDEEWTEAARLLAIELPKKKQFYAEGEKKAAEWRNSHPAYRKRR